MTRILCVGLVLAAGCGASAIGAQADMIAVTGAIVHEADEVIVTVRARKLEAVVERAVAECQAGCDEARRERDRLEMQAIEERWAPVRAAHALVVDALHAWVEGLEVARAAHTESVGIALLLRLAARVAALYGDLVDLLAEVAPDVHLPGLPGELGGGS